MQANRAPWSLGALALAVAAGCASTGQAGNGLKMKSGAASEATSDELPPALKVAGPPVPVEDTAIGASFDLPALEGGWSAPREGRGGRRGAGLQVEIGSFPLARDATPAACRDAARARLPKEAEQSAGKGGSVREQTIGDWPTAIWSFTRGSDDAPVRSRWAFFPRGSDCLLLEVTGPRGDRFADLAFDTAARTFKARPVSSDRQREIDLLAGMGFLERRDPSSALERFESLARREPTFAKAHFGALMAGFELGPQAYSRALPHGLAALKAERDLSQEQRQLALRAVGVMQLAENQLKGAAQTLAELVVRAPDLAEGQYNYACALARLGETKAALDHLRTAVRLDHELVKHAKDDEDLKSLRGEPRFESILASPPPAPGESSLRKVPEADAAPETQPGDDE